MARVFDSLPKKSEDLPVDALKKEGMDEKMAEYIRRKKEEPWGGKRALLAMVNRGMGGDGTVIYYVVLEGTVKPRQN